MYRLKFFMILLAFAGVSFSQNIIKTDRVYPNELNVKAFQIDNNSEITIEGKLGNFDNWGNWGERLVFYGWLLDSKTREVIWNILDKDDYLEEKGLYFLEEKLSLKSGTYELYLTGVGTNYYKDNKGGISGFLNKIFGGGNQFKRKIIDDISIKVLSEKENIKPINYKEAAEKYSKNAFVSIKRIRDDKTIVKGFSLGKDLEIRIYALGEGRHKKMSDLAWIYDVKHNRRVWTMNWQECKHAGGASKNIELKGNVFLEKGSYQVFYQTDDSHSYEEWNELLPYDPQYWGITLWTVNQNDKKYILPFKETDIEKPIVEITKIRDNELVSKGVKTLKDSYVRIYALGEGRHGKMSDYGWIENDKGEIIWETTYRKTKHAGGGSKNREVDEKILLPKGNYIVYYKTDDSHSYKDWNVSPPYDKDRWGITIWNAETNSKNNFEIYKDIEKMDKSLITQIIKVGDDKKIIKPFEFLKNTKIKIYAIGEGSRHDEMSDYGWIENDRGEIIWEMTYRKTKHAGGASKNRKCNMQILLEAGKYKLCYKTDGSHSYEDWNARKPNRETMYGISIYKVE